MASKLSDSDLESLQMIRCPYNRNHVVKTSKYQIHLTHCQKNMNVWDRNRWTCCPFNANHRVLFNDFMAHLIQCKSNAVFRYIWQKADVKQEKNVNNEVALMDRNAISDTNVIKKESNIKVENCNKTKKKDIDDWDLHPSGILFDGNLSNHDMKAEDVFEENKFTDQWLLSRLNKTERKRLNDMRIELANRKSITAMVDRSDGQFAHFNTKLSQQKCSGDVKNVKTVDIPLNGLISNEHKDSVLSRSLRSIDISDDDVYEFKIISEKPIRRPMTNPFSSGQQLRRPFTLKTKD